ncbi:RagB/SusD family nutrient uptake outer membrane protein [Chitinophaga flava]|nr:RagB/SusD family nutrient uptake outer membrane protein [Chitinophaga flava]
MKRTNLYILLLATGLLASCQKELLKPVPTTDISAFSAFENAERIANQVNGMYSVLKNGKFLGGKLAVANEVRAGDFVVEGSNSVTLYLTWSMIPNGTAQEVIETWEQGYLTINNANVFIDGMNAVGTKVVGDELSKKYIGEAKFVRALSYFTLLQIYARPYWDGAGSKPGLVLHTQGHTKKEDYNKARASVAEVYAQILKDLDDAEGALPAATAGNKASITHATSTAAVALKTRVYLHMANYAKVITEANKLVSAAAPFVSPTKHALAPDITKVFASNYQSTESVFSLPFTSVVGDYPGTQTQLGFYYSTEYSIDAKSGVFADATWKAGDARRSFIRTVGAKSYWNKFSTPSPYTDWIPVIRYAEVLLNLAEAKVRSTNTVDAQAVALLSAVRGRSDAGTTYTTADFADANALLTAIQNEKHIEFIGEGMRGNEITRLGQTIPGKSNPAVTIDPVPSNSSKYIWPVSANELLYNKLCVDNQ